MKHLFSNVATDSLQSCCLAIFQRFTLNPHSRNWGAWESFRYCSNAVPKVPRDWIATPTPRTVKAPPGLEVVDLMLETNRVHLWLGYVGRSWNAKTLRHNRHNRKSSTCSEIDILDTTHTSTTWKTRLTPPSGKGSKVRHPWGKLPYCLGIY